LVELLAKNLQQLSSPDKSLILAIVKASISDKVESIRILA
jgi:hypothetical protein